MSAAAADDEAEDVGTGALHRRAWDAMTELFIGLFRAGIQRL